MGGAAARDGSAEKYFGPVFLWPAPYRVKPVDEQPAV